MKTSNLGNVAIGSSSRPRKKFDWTHDVNTTCEWGSIQPLMCRLIPAGSKSKLSTEQLIRFAPLVVPTFGRVKVKNWHYFCAFSEISQNFAALMSETPVSRSNGVEFVPKKVPYMPLSMLSMMVLYGAHMTVWERQETGGLSTADGDLPKSGNSGALYELYTVGSQLANTAETLLFGTNALLDHDAYQFGYDHYWLNFKVFLPQTILSKTLAGANLAAGDRFKVPLSNPYAANKQGFVFDTYQLDANNNPVDVTNFCGVDVSVVDLESADEVITFDVLDSNSVKHSFALAFRLSSFGKRLKKILQGLGYQVDFYSEADVSLMPLFAFYKAYYDVFGLLLYENWENTPCAKLLASYDFNNFTQFAYCWQTAQALTPPDYTVSTNMQYWFDFLKDLGAVFYTDSQDYVSAHTTVINPQTYELSQKFKNKFIDVTDDGTNPSAGLAVDSMTPVSGESMQGMSGNLQPYYNNHAFIDRVFHGQLDSEVLKRMYKCTNIRTVAGQRVREIALSQGLGDFISTCKPNFIGYSEFTPNISDVVAMSDTFDAATKSGRMLGEQGAKGLGYDRSKDFYYENSEPGFWITLSVVLPQGGYSQAVDQSVKCIEKLDFFNPEWDAVGPEVTPKDAIVGALDWHSMSNSSGAPLSSKGFGFIPRYSSLKVKQNILNGDFALRSKKDAFAPYTLDRLINLNSRKIQNDLPIGTVEAGQGVVKKNYVVPLMLAENLPCAGNLWRYITRYEWLAHFDRIFAYMGDSVDNYVAMWNQSQWSGVNTRDAWEFVHNSDDNFMLHNLIRFVCHAPMLPISDSFETLDDGNEGKISTNISKA